MNARPAVTVSYFAQLRELRGHAREQLEILPDDTAATLYERICTIHGIDYPLRDLRVAINDEFADFSRALKPSDHVVFIPPVAGG